MGKALYRKYRSKSLAEIVGQEHITDTLDQALKSGRISHAYLFTGPRGTGKTSIARILAHEINDLPYTDDSAHMDIIEIDAASNRRIDEIRELREKVYVAPTSAKYKVYIIDEVHMLTKEAFNALLKTLEEPPEHVVFILATTDAHKLPETIVSRTQRYSFKPVEKAKVVAHLKQISEKEKIAVSDDALDLLAEHGEGSFRDSISLLDQASNNGGKLELSDVQTLLGIPPTEAIDQLLDSLMSNVINQTMKQLEGLYNAGYQASSIAKELAARLRQQIASNSLGLPLEAAFDLLGQLLEVPVAHDPERYLEIILFRTQYQLSGQENQVTSPVKEVKGKQSARQVPPDNPSAKVEPKTQEVKADEPKEPEETSTKAALRAAVTKSTKPFDLAVWADVLAALKQKHNTLYGVARMAEPTLDDNNTLQLAFSFAFHQKRLNEAKNRQVIADIIKDLTGQDMQIECIVDKSATPPQVEVQAAAKKPAPKKSDLSTISNIFGGAELLES